MAPILFAFLVPLNESKRRVGSPGVFITPGTYFILIYSFCYQKVWEIWSNVKAFFQKNWKKQIFIDFFTRLTNFKWLWKVNSQAFSNQTFFIILTGFQLIKIFWKTRARCWHLVLAVPNVKIFFCKNSPFWRFSGNSFQSFQK